MGIQVTFREGGSAYLTEPDYGVFRKEVMEKLASICGAALEIKETRVLKNNSVELYGIVLFENNSTISPAIYLESFYEAYCRGYSSIDDIAHDILRVYSKSQTDCNMDIEEFKDFPRISEKIVYHLINYDRNRELLMNAPHRRFLDLAIVYSAYLGESKYGNCSIAIKNEHLNMWGKAERDLYRIAEKNTKRIFKPVVRNIYDLLLSRYPEKEKPFQDFQFILESGEREESLPMFVLTNETGFRGAGSILYPGLIKELSAKLDSDLYLLPSSIHEFISVPSYVSISGRELKDLVESVNRTAVEAEEFLSDNVYEYSRIMDEISNIVN